LKHLLIAGAFLFLDKSGLDPLHERMKPKQRRDKHVNRSSHVVAPADVT